MIHLHGSSRGNTGFRLSAFPGTLLLFIFSSCLNWIGEPIERVSNQQKANLVTRKDAQKKIALALFTATAECPVFYRSCNNLFVGWTAMLTSGPANEYKSLTGTADSGFVDKQELKSCIATIYVLQQACAKYGTEGITPDGACVHEKGDITRAYLLSFGACSGALKSNAMPFFVI